VRDRTRLAGERHSGNLSYPKPQTGEVLAGSRRQADVTNDRLKGDFDGDVLRMITQARGQKVQLFYIEDYHDIPPIQGVVEEPGRWWKHLLGSPIFDNKNI
jgi:hypothetical protein